MRSDSVPVSSSSVVDHLRDNSKSHLRSATTPRADAASSRKTCHRGSENQRNGAAWLRNIQDAYRTGTIEPGENGSHISAVHSCGAQQPVVVVAPVHSA